MNRCTRGFAAVLGLVIAAGTSGCGDPEPADAPREPLPAYQAPVPPAAEPAPPPLPAAGSEPDAKPLGALYDAQPDDGLGEYPAWNGVDLDCSDIGHPVRVTGPDPHRLDADGNGAGCESQ